MWILLGHCGNEMEVPSREDSRRVNRTPNDRAVGATKFCAELQMDVGKVRHDRRWENIMGRAGRQQANNIGNQYHWFLATPRGSHDCCGVSSVIRCQTDKHGLLNPPLLVLITQGVLVNAVIVLPLLVLGLVFLAPFIISPSSFDANARGIGIRAGDNTVANPWVVGALATKAGIPMAKSAPARAVDLSKRYPLERPPDASKVHPPPDL